MLGDNISLVDFMKYLVEETHHLNFGNFFSLVSDSYLTTFLLFFLAGWILNICISIGKWGEK